MPLCPKCQTQYPDNMLICVPCGINMKTGQQLRTQSAAVPDIPDLPPESGEDTPKPWLADNFPGALRPKTLTLSAGLGALGFGITLFALYTIVAGGADFLFGSFCIAAVGVLLSAQAWAWLITGEIWLLNTAMLEFQSKDWTNLSLALIVPVTVVFAVMKLSTSRETTTDVLKAKTEAVIAAAQKSEYVIKPVPLAPGADLGGARSKLALSHDGNIYFSEVDGFVVCQVNANTGVVSVIAGDGNKNYTGDGGPALKANLNYPGSVAVAANGDVYFMDSKRIRKIDAKLGTIDHFAGAVGKGDVGDGGPAKSAQFTVETYLNFDAKGNLLITDAENHCIRRIDMATGRIHAVAGTGTSGFSGDGGPATAAELKAPRAAVADRMGNIYIADTGNQRIRKIDNASGNITTIAGSTGGHGGDGGPATAAKIGSPLALAIADNNDIYVASSNHRIYRYDNDKGTISTIAGNGALGYSGDGGPSLNAQLESPASIVVEPNGSILIGDSRNRIIRRLVRAEK